MKIFVKELKGNEIELTDLGSDTQIVELKKEIESKLNIPVLQQKLLYLGKILNDSCQIKDYLIKDNAKLMLTRVPKPDLKKLLHQHFSRFYDSETSTEISNQFIENMKLKLKDYSLDDLERLANAAFLKES